MKLVVFTLFALLAVAQAQENFQVRVRFFSSPEEDAAPAPSLLSQDDGPSFFRRMSLPIIMRNMFSSFDSQPEEEPESMRIIRIVSSDDQNDEQPNPMATVSRMFMRLRGLINAVQEQNMDMSQEENRPSAGCPLRRACQDDVDRLCADAEGVPGAVPACLRENLERVSEQCSSMLRKFFQQDDEEDQGGEDQEKPSQEGDADENGVEPEYVSQDSDDTETVTSSSSSSDETPEATSAPQVHGPCAGDAARLCPGVTEKRAIAQCLLQAELTSHDLSAGCHLVLSPLIGHEGRSVRRDVPMHKIASAPVAKPSSSSTTPLAQVPMVPLMIGGAALTVLGVIVVIVQRRNRARREAAPAPVVVQLANPSAEISQA